MKLDIPFYSQSTEFTCDPACLMMALKYFYSEIELSKELEFDIWREAYGIGIPGCMPQGLAYSTLLRKLNATLICKKENLVEMSEKLAAGENKEITLFTSQTLLKKAIDIGLNLFDKSPNLEDIENALSKNQIPIVMVNMKLLHNIDSPHWIIVSGMNKENLWINDPYNKNGRDFVIKRKEILQMMDDLKKYSGIEKRMLLIFK